METNTKRIIKVVERYNDKGELTSVTTYYSDGSVKEE